MTIDENHIRAIVKKIGKLSDCPMDVSMRDLGLDSAQLQRIQFEFTKHFNRTLETIFFRDTVYTLTDRLTKKPLRESA